ncbi:KICSTOR complex protein C12orf66 [Taenia crassiceps]|uniref:KICSTOR complex protein C12orf66 n=1 Tax=Taenia crassiceps TaxID=6207 RepID=A0ABR4QUD5_9CEST
MCEDLMRSYKGLRNDVLPTQIEALIEQIHHFCRLRCKLISFFALITRCETMLCSAAKNVGSALEELYALRSPINCLGSTISPLINIARMEVEILAAALKVQCQLGDLEFLNSILTLSSISYKLDQYYARNDLLGMESPPTPLCLWLRALYSVLLAKFTLYWYSVLHSGATNPSDMQEAVMKENPAIVFQIQDFVRTNEGTTLSLFFDAYLQDFAYLGHSYVPPGAAEMYVKSSVAIPCIFTMPPVESNTLPVSDYAVIMRAVNSLLSVDASSLPRRIISLHEAQLQKSFFVLKVESRIYMAIVVEKKKEEEEEVEEEKGTDGQQKEDVHIRELMCRLCDCIQMADLCRCLQRST